MIWSIFSKSKDNETLINELKSENEETRESAYKELINKQDESCESFLINELTLPITPKETKIDIIDILGLRTSEKALPTFQKLLKTFDKEIYFAIYKALFNICSSDTIDELVKQLTINEEDLKKTLVSYILKIPTDELLGSFLRCVPQDKNSQLYFEIVTIMEDLELFDSLKNNFNQPDPMIKEFYFSTIIKFNRPDFIPLFLSFYPIASSGNKEIIIEILSDYELNELIKYFAEYINSNSADGIIGLIDIVILPKSSNSLLLVLKFIISLNDIKYKIKVLPNLLKKIDPFCYDTVFDLLSYSSVELRELALNCLIELVRKTYKRIKDPKEPNKTTLTNFIGFWEKQITSIMRTREDLNEDYYKTVRKLFFEFCSYNHELVRPVIIDLVSKDFYEIYYLLKDWSFDDKYDIYLWIIKTEPSFGSILLSSLNARADDVLWRLAIKLSNAFEDEEDSNVFRKNLVTRYHNISIEKFLRDDDPEVRAAAIEIFAQMKSPGYLDIIKSYTKDPDSCVRKSAIKCLINDRSIITEKVAIEALEDPDPEIDLYILKKVKNQIDANKISSYLIRYINSENEDLRNYAKQEIATLTKERYKINYNNMKPEMRKLAAQAIQKIDSNFSDEIINDLRSYDPSTRLKAALLLENIQVDEKGKYALISAMKDPSKKVRAAIVKTLGIVGDKEVVKHLISFFNDPDARVRANTIEAIASLGDNTVTRILFPYLEDSNNRIRANAIVGICRFGKYNVTQILQNMLSDKDNNMKASALWAIGEIGEPLYMQLAFQYLQDQNELIRFNAIKAISRINPPYMPLLRKDKSQKIRNLVKELSYKLI